MVRAKRAWDKAFLDYMSFIVDNKNYAGLPEPKDSTGKIKWVVTGKSELGKKREAWWQQKVKELKVKQKSDVARLIHPKELNGLKPCQICGKKLSIFYDYPKKLTLKRLNDLSGLDIKPYTLNIDDLFDAIYLEKKDLVFQIFKKVFDVPSDIKDTKKDILLYIKTNSISRLSPGVMSNPPDRFDGFHTYNSCCRSKEDTGRSKENLARYTQDRRAYENWADGDYNLANRLMGEYQRYKKKLKCPNCGNISKMSADHIGPISLGFTHRPKFNPLCDSCNSSKNNRMTLSDVTQLIDEEKEGLEVISWHSKYLWNLLKHKVKSNEDAKVLSDLMRKNLHNVLYLFYNIHLSCGEGFLKRYLHPEYSFYDYKFDNFDPLDMSKLRIHKKECNSKNKIKNSERYLRISFESLAEYNTKENRKSDISSLLTNEAVSSLIQKVKQDNLQDADKALKDLLKKVGTDLSLSFTN